MLNRIITRGFGPSRGVPGVAGPITQGYGGVPPFVVAAIRRGVKLGQSGTKRRLRELDTVIVWARLLEVNGVVPPRKIAGQIAVNVKKDGRMAVALEHVSTRTKAAWESLKVVVSRVKRDT